MQGVRKERKSERKKKKGETREIKKEREGDFSPSLPHHTHIQNVGAPGGLCRDSRGREGGSGPAEVRDRSSSPRGRGRERSRRAGAGGAASSETVRLSPTVPLPVLFLSKDF